MSARKGSLLSAPKYTAIMSCSDGPAASAFLVDSLIGGRSEGAAAGGGAHYTGLCLPHGAAATEVAYGLHSYGYFPGVVAKRSEAAPQHILSTTTSTTSTSSSSSSSSGAYMSGMEMWMDAQRSCRMEQQQPLPCSFPQSIKEENTYCLYEPPHCPKASTAEELSYSRLTTGGLGSAACSLSDGGSVGDGGSVPVPGYFRLSQTHAHAHKLSNSSNNSSSSGGGGVGGDGCSSSSSPQPTPPHSHFGSHHTSAASRFHTPPSSTPARESRSAEEPVAATGSAEPQQQQRQQLQAAPGSREQERDSSDAEGSSADEAEELETDRRAAAGLKGKASVPRCGPSCMVTLRGQVHWGGREGGW